MAWVSLTSVPRVRSQSNGPVGPRRVSLEVSGPASVPVSGSKPGGGASLARRVELQRHAGEQDDVVVQVLEVEVDAAALEVAANRGAHLIALVGREARVANTVVLAPEAADAGAPITDRAAVVGVDALEAVVAGLHLHDPFPGLALARDEVHRAAGRVRSEDRRRAATHHLDPVDGLVQAERLVGVQITQAAVMLDRRAVFLQGDGREAFLRDAAGADVGAGLAARGLDPETGHRLQRVGHAHWRAQAQGLFVHGGDGVAGRQARAGVRAGARGDDQFLDRVGRVSAGRGGVQRADAPLAQGDDLSGGRGDLQVAAVDQLADRVLPAERALKAGRAAPSGDVVRKQNLHAGLTREGVQRLGGVAGRNVERHPRGRLGPGGGRGDGDQRRRRQKQAGRHARRPKSRPKLGHRLSPHVSCRKSASRSARREGRGKPPSRFEKNS